MSEQKAAPVGIGVISIITVLLVLCLTMFAALTLSSARADLALSEKNADTVSAYYAADAQAAQLYADFAAGAQPELETTLPMTDNQSLYLHLVREGDGVRILAWQTVSTEAETEFDEYLPVWDGAPPEG